MRFILVHGAYHGAWCWDRMVPELEIRGHEVVPLDLPIEDPEAGASAYAAVIESAVSGDDTVVVGHSMMGLAIPLVRGAARLVFLCAYVPRVGQSFNQQRAQDQVDPDVELNSAEFTDRGSGVWMVGPNTATELFYHDAPVEDAEWAFAHLRPQAYKIMSEVTPLTNWPDTPLSYVLCRDDHAVSPVWARQVARERLGVEAIEMEGGHSPFLTRPAELAQVLDAAST